jgi:hypothetical protein
MRVATVEIKGVSPYSQCRPVPSTKEPKETHEDFEKRTWKERAHIDDEGRAFIPPMAWKIGIAEAAKFLSIQIPGKGKSTYTKHFEAGVLVTEPAYIGATADDMQSEWLFVPATGRRGDGKRVWKCFPKFSKWACTVTFYILDDTITKDVFAQHIEEMGKFIGVGRFRARNNGFYGRFEVMKVNWS